MGKHTISLFVIMLPFLGAPNCFAILTSTFDSDAEGWTAYDPNNDYHGSWQSSGGNPGGFYQGSETSPAGGVGYFIAPSTWAGDWSQYLDGTLMYDFKIIQGTSYFAADDVRIYRDSNYVKWSSTQPPLYQWVTMQVSLDADHFVPGTSGADFNTIMSNVTALWIRGEVINYGEKEGLDNVIVLPAFDWQGGAASNPTDWSVAENWIPGTIAPDHAGVKVSFGNQSAANNVVDLISAGRTVGDMVFHSTTGTTIQSAGGFSLTLDNNGGVSSIDVAGEHAIDIPVILANDAEVSGSGLLHLSGGLTGPYAFKVTGGEVIAASIQVESLSIGDGSKVRLPPRSAFAKDNAVAPVPEPAVLMLMTTAAVILWAYSRQRRGK